MKGLRQVYLKIVLALTAFLWGMPAQAQIGPDIYGEMSFNHTDFLFGFGGGVAFQDIGLSARLNFLTRARAKKVLIEERPDFFYQFRERRYLLGLEVEKRFRLADVGQVGQVGVLLSAWGGINLGDYRGSTQAVPGGLNVMGRAGAYITDEGFILRMGYAYVPTYTPSVFAHRIFIQIGGIIPHEY